MNPAVIRDAINDFVYWFPYVPVIVGAITLTVTFLRTRAEAQREDW